MKQANPPKHEAKRRLQLLLAPSKATFCQISISWHVRSQFLGVEDLLIQDVEYFVIVAPLACHTLAFLAVMSWPSYLGIENLLLYKSSIMCKHELKFPISLSTIAASSHTRFIPIQFTA